MKYLARAQLEESLRALRPFNMFYGTTFLVLKSAKVPVGSKKRFILDAENRDFLNTHYRVHPKSKQFFRALRQGSTTQDWLSPKYPSSGLQAINTQTFRDALLHEANDNTWGWSNDYISVLASKLPRGIRIPIFDLASWIYKFDEWEDDTRRDDISQRFIKEFELTDLELASIFQVDLTSNLSETEAFQEIPIKWHELLAPYSRPLDVPAESSGILNYLEMEGIGPVPKLVFQPAHRLNLITGDNGLGKTFLLDISWWALTQDWVDRPATPFAQSPTKSSLIKFVVGGPHSSEPVRASYSHRSGKWEARDARAAMSGLVVYARLDGSFAVWDPANRVPGNANGVTQWPGIKFTREEIWDGKKGQIEGLISDWTKWQLRPDRYPAFETFKGVLARVSPPDLPLEIGEPIRIPGPDNREIPTLKHVYDSVPILFESAGIRRILTLAYLLVWAWEEHKILAKHQGKQEERQMVVLIDEVEAHLHPKWQRVILPGLLSVAKELHEEMSIQWIIASHSPLVLASGEDIWNTDSDKLFHIDMSDKGKISFAPVEFERRGTVDSWLSSELFELRQPGSTEREKAIQEAIRVQELANPTKQQVENADRLLRNTLASEDEFWIRWVFFADTFGVTD